MPKVSKEPSVAVAHAAPKASAGRRSAPPNPAQTLKAEIIRWRTLSDEDLSAEHFRITTIWQYVLRMTCTMSEGRKGSNGAPISPDDAEDDILMKKGRYQADVPGTLKLMVEEMYMYRKQYRTAMRMGLVVGGGMGMMGSAGGGMPMMGMQGMGIGVSMNPSGM